MNAEIVQSGFKPRKEKERFPTVPSDQTGSGTHPASMTTDIVGASEEAKYQELEADLSPPSTDVKV
jgi:hypothetical protein